MNFTKSPIFDTLQNYPKNWLQWCCWLYDDNSFEMLQNHNIGDFFVMLVTSKSANSNFNRSLTSQSCNQHMPSQKFVTNIDIASKTNENVETGKSKSHLDPSLKTLKVLKDSLGTHFRSIYRRNFNFWGFLKILAFLIEF